MNVASATCSQTSSAGSSSAYWEIPTNPWQAISTQTAVSAVCACGLARRARSRNHTPTAASPKNAAVLPCRWIAQSIVSAPCQVIRSMMSPVPSPPACGPAAVAIVPPASVAAPGSSSARTDQVLTRSVLRGGSSGSYVARHTSATHATSSSIESRKCMITHTGARS